MLKFILIILDGFGLREEKKGNAFALANTPNLDQMINECPISSIETSGKFVGLPSGIMGNSEVGHMNLGAGRIIKQDLVRINDAIKSDELCNNSRLQDIFRYVKSNSSTLHIIGLISDGGVHSHLSHLEYVLDAARSSKINKLAIHAITDGRDTDPKSGKKFIEDLMKNSHDAQVATVCGRYYSMDRDHRWERIKKSYDLMVKGKGEKTQDIAMYFISF